MTGGMLYIVCVGRCGIQRSRHHSNGLEHSNAAHWPEPHPGCYHHLDDPCPDTLVESRHRDLTHLVGLTYYFCFPQRYNISYVMLLENVAARISHPTPFGTQWPLGYMIRPTPNTVHAITYVRCVLVLKSSLHTLPDPAESLFFTCPGQVVFQLYTSATASESLLISA